MNKGPFSTTKHPVRWIKVRDLTVKWRSAQREFSVIANAKKIAGAFDVDLFGNLAVSQPDEKGKYHIIDGETRWTAVKMMWGDDEEVPCEVLPVTTAKESAQVFLGRNKGRRPVSAIDHFRNSVTAEDPDSLIIQKVVRAAGYRVTNAPYADGNIRSVGALSHAYRRWGPDILKDTLTIIPAIWGMDHQAVKGQIVGGFANVLGEFHGRINYGRLVDVMRKRFPLPSRLLASSQGMREATGGSVTENVQKIIMENYNRGLKTGQLK